MALVPALGLAADLGWRGKPFQIMANDKPLADFLRELAASQGTTAVVDTKVQGSISGKFNASALSILDNVTATYGYTWYYDGTFLHIDPVENSRSEVFAVASAGAARANQMLSKLKISDPRFPLSFSETDGTVSVTGPRRYVDMVRQALQVAEDRSAQTDRSEVRLFPLKYAWASDFRITRSGKEVVIPGVATTLRDLFPRGAPAASRVPAASSAPSIRLGPTRQIRLSSGETVNAPKVEVSAADTSIRSGGSDSSARGNELPRFNAETRLNAVLIRDLPERMAQYAQLIESMDVRPRLVEIEVTIMDVATDTLDSLGVDWRLHSKHGDLQIGQGKSASLTWGGATSEAGQTGVTTPIGLAFTASIGNDLRNYLLARVRALATDGRANMVARPKLLTLDNTEATLENLNDLHIRVGGFQDAGLFSITAGTAVRVTPLIVDDQPAPSVKLSLDIQDGSLAAESVDNIPIVRRRTVNTQALVSAGKSLLIAGFSSEEKSVATVGVPGLSRLPLLGNLFKFTENKQITMERLYLLTPRLVGPEPGS